MPLTNRIKNQHLLWRAAFGPMAENAASLDTTPPAELWKQLVATSAAAPEPITVAVNVFDGVLKGIQDVTEITRLTKEQQKQLREQSRDELKTLNTRWLSTMVNSEQQLREKMSLFWHGHFACRVINSYFQQQLLQVIRANALGNFGSLLKEVSKTPAMLQFLNNQQNRKQHPNENFAREVMELFTMGRGNYTEVDVKEAARAFTGWGFNLKGEFVSRSFQHDDGAKTVLGKTDNFDGDEVLDHILAQPVTAQFIVRKLYRFLVNETPDEARVQQLANRFYKNKYEILPLLTDIFTSEWFYDAGNIGTHIKSPVELLVGIQRILPLQISNEASLLLFQRTLGQILFYPPNVAGWPGGKSWIDSSTLMLRMRIPKIIMANEPINIQAKTDDDVQMGQMAAMQASNQVNKQFAAKGAAVMVDWPLVVSVFEKVARPQLADSIARTLLQSTGNIPKQTIQPFLDESSRENFIKSAIINYMSIPEYQLS